MLPAPRLARCMQAGHIGVQIGNHVGPKNLDDPGIVTFLHHCADVGAAVLVHPWDMMAQERMPKYMMPWTVGMPAETQLAVSSLVLSGAFDRLPKTLRICFAHGGGSFAFLLGRMQNAWVHQPLARGACRAFAHAVPGSLLRGFGHFRPALAEVACGSHGRRPRNAWLGLSLSFGGRAHRRADTAKSTFPRAAKQKMLGGNAASFSDSQRRAGV